MIKKHNLLLWVVGLSLLSACTGEEDIPVPENGLTTLIAIENEPAGANCSNGGLLVKTGVDLNNDGVLQETEVSARAYVCNGENGADGQDGQDGQNGLNSAVRAQTIEAGNECVNGGLRIDVGLDENGNGILDDEEVVSSHFVCNGIDGTNGSDGADGTNGTNGTDGTTSRVSVTPEPVGENCSEGGLRIDVGLDGNANGALDATEITSTSYVCNGTNGTNGADGQDGTPGDPGQDGVSAANVLIASSMEPAGSNCDNGGFKVSVGYDADENESLEASEVTSVSYLCIGVQTEVNKGRTYLIIQGDLSQEEAQVIIDRDAGSNTQFVFIQSTTNIKYISLPGITTLVDLIVFDNDSLVSLSMPDLRQVSRNMQIEESFQLKSVDFTSL